MGGPDGKYLSRGHDGPSATTSVRHDRVPNFFPSGSNKLNQNEFHYMTTKCRKFETRRDRGAYTKTTKSHKKRLYNTNLSLVFWSQRYEETYFYVKRDLLYYFRFSFKFLQQNLKKTAFTTVSYGIQLPS